MTTTSTPARAGAIGLGALFAVCTACVVFSDVTAIGDLSIDHMMTGAVLIGTLAAGHWFGIQARQAAIVTAAGLALMFAAGTFYLVTTSAARNAESSAGKLAIVQSANGNRAALERDLSDAKAALAEARSASRRECASGNGKRCEGTRSSIADAQAAVDLAASKLDGAPVAQVEHAGWKHASLVYSIITGADPAAIERAIELLFPFVKAAFLELGTLTFFGIGFRHKAEPAVSEPGEPVSHPVSSGTEVEFASADKVIDWVAQFRAKHGRNPQIPELQAEFRIPKTTAWRRIKASS